MVAELIGELVPPDQPADALILGFAMPDVWPERATAAFLSHVCPGNPMAFAVCDQGCAAGFTALRLARDYAAGGGCDRVLVVLAEQTRLDYDPPAPVSMPTRNAVFAMLCDAAHRAGRTDAGGAPLVRAVRVLPGVPAGQASAILRREVSLLETGEGEEERTLVLGEGLSPLADQGVLGRRNTLALPQGQPVTGVWRELAAWATTAGGGRLTIADYDPGLQYLCLAAFARAQD
jgi:4-hydroxymandelate oxidase